MKIMQASFATLMTALLGGCVSIEQHTERLSGTPRADGARSLRHITPGETTRDALIDRLGTPDAAWQAESGSEILRYDHVRSTRTQVSALILLDVDVKRDRVDHLYFEIRDDRVARYWHEKD